MVNVTNNKIPLMHDSEGTKLYKVGRNRVIEKDGETFVIRSIMPLEILENYILDKPLSNLRNRELAKKACHPDLVCNYGQQELGADDMISKVEKGEGILMLRKIEGAEFVIYLEPFHIENPEKTFYELSIIN
ncbi:hypothetical protein KO465_02280 [Candidatus Micrarchaeota archaeon]|jgi:hypothetical protein|nr:hypothetical protein [Candidatus Micrarchaeota archaeon]